MKVISVRPVWAWLIVNGFKDVENRTWKTRYRGAILVHASARISIVDHNNARDLIRQRGLDIVLPDPGELQHGGIIGLTCVTGCVTESSSRWFVGPHAFELQGSRPVPFSALKGRLGIFDVDLSALGDDTRSAIMMGGAHE